MSSSKLRIGAWFAVLSIIVGACTTGASPTPEPQATPTATATVGTADLRWYCCLGTGEAPEQQPVEKAIAADFGTAHPGSTLTFEVVTYDAARDTLSTQIAADNAPDIVGPAGVGGLEAFHGQWLDLAPLIASSGFDVSQYPEGAVNFYKTPDGQIGLPFAVYPSMTWYSPPLFDEAGLNYPPHKYGEKYVMPDGSEVDWNYDTVKEIAEILTVDANGNDATQAGFDPNNIVQYGFEPQRDDLRGLGAYFGAGSLLDADGQTARVPDAWRDAWKYFYDGMWTEHFIMTGPVFDAVAPDAGGYAFFTGNVAMSTNFLWTTYGVGEGSAVEGKWDLAAIPAHKGTVTSPLNADTFAIMKTTKAPEVAFQGLTYLQVDRGAELLDIYGGMPALTADQDAFFQTQDQNFAHGVDWQVVKDSLGYADNPNFEAFIPKYNESLDTLGTYLSKWTTTPGLDMDAEITALEQELQAIWSS